MYNEVISLFSGQGVVFIFYTHFSLISPVANRERFPARSYKFWLSPFYTLLRERLSLRPCTTLCYAWGKAFR